jgi:hypothetical protein
MNPKISDFLPQFDLVPIVRDGKETGAFAKVLGFDELNELIKQGTDNFVRFGCRLLAIAFVKADGTPVGTEEEWIARATFKAKDKLLALINEVARVNGVLTKDEAADLGNASTPIGGSDSNSSCASDSVEPVANSEKL